MHWSRNGNPRRKVYLTPDKLVPYSDYWPFFRDAHHQSIEVTGYPTEKNFSMLKMIIAASSDPGDLVIDPFCGSGTTLQAAENLKRRWIGFDESFVAIQAALTRLRHGVKPMGDFVERSHSATKIVDLFADELESSQDVNSQQTPIPFHFFADAELANPFASEIRQLAST